MDPVVIATLGNFATRFMLGRAEGITRLRGRLFRVEDRFVLPIFHPAVALYDPSKRTVLEEDFRRLAAVIARVKRGELDPRGGAGSGGTDGDASGPADPVQPHLDLEAGS